MGVHGLGQRFYSAPPKDDTAHSTVTEVCVVGSTPARFWPLNLRAVSARRT